MDITKIRYFSVVAEAGSLRKAAELLQISPPALSRAISQLEQELEMELFIPSGRGIAITDQGRRFHRRAVRLLGLICQYFRRHEPSSPLPLLPEARLRQHRDQSQYQHPTTQSAHGESSLYVMR